MQLTWNRLTLGILGLWLSLGPSNLWASDVHCAKKDFSIIENGSVISEAQEICFITFDSNEFYVSESCANGNCMAIKKQLGHFRFRDFLSPYGKPGFHLCKRLGGFPTLINLTQGDELIRTDKCRFKDGSFVATDYLIELYLNEPLRER